MATRLVISEDAYALLQRRGGNWAELTALAGGGRALLNPALPVDEARLEAAIEIAEDWLMPHASSLCGDVLEVEDATGRLRSGLEEVLGLTATALSVDEVEHVFLRLIDLATGRNPQPSLEQRQMFVADVLLLRELAHHGQLRGLRLCPSAR